MAECSDRFKARFAYRERIGFFSIIIPVAFDASGLADTLASMEPLRSLGDRIEITVVNDGASQEVRAVAETYRVRTIEIAPNQGSYHARNQGIAASQGEFLVFLDADQIADPGWFGALRLAVTQADYVAGNVVIDPRKVKSIGHRLDAALAFPIEAYLRRDHFAPTANLAVRRSVIEAVGWFDDRLRSGGDAEFGQRAWSHGGLRMTFCAGMVTFHPPRSLRQQATKARRVIGGQIQLVRFHPGRFDHLAPSIGRAIRHSRPRRVHHVPRYPSGGMHLGRVLMLNVIGNVLRVYQAWLILRGTLVPMTSRQAWTSRYNAKGIE